jgi:hypothetical protein
MPPLRGVHRCKRKTAGWPREAAWAAQERAVAAEKAERTAKERAVAAEKAERAAKEAERAAKERAWAKLRALGIDPDEE